MSSVRSPTWPAGWWRQWRSARARISSGDLSYSVRSAILSVCVILLTCALPRRDIRPDKGASGEGRLCHGDHVSCKAQDPGRRSGKNSKQFTIFVVVCVLFSDLRRQLARRGVPYRDPTHFPQRTVYAMRILAGVKDHSTRVSLSHDLYRVSRVCVFFVLCVFFVVCVCVCVCVCKV